VGNISLKKRVARVSDLADFHPEAAPIVNKNVNRFSRFRNIGVTELKDSKSGASGLPC
jgi:hypothetical protein